MLDLGLTFARPPEVVKKELTQVSIDLDRKGLVAGLREIAKPMARHMRRGAPKQQGGGALRKSIGYRTLRKKASAALTGGVGAGIRVGVVRWVSDPKYYRSPGQKINQEFKAHWLENVPPGPHPINLILGSGKRALKFGKVIVRRIKRHPGHERQPFIDPAYKAYQAKVDEFFASGIDKFLEK